MSVDRCICHSISFDALKQIAAEGQLDFDALSQQTKCCTGCGLCEPYVRQMLATGFTRFHPAPTGMIPKPILPRTGGSKDLYY